MDSFDYVIVGAGSAGSVLANRLSEDPATSICVLEAGPRDWHPYIHLPAGFIKTFYNTRINWCYSQEPTEGTAGRRIFSPRGKTLGGSSSINGHIYNRGQRGDFNTWAQYGNRGWGYADVLPYLSASSGASATARRPIAARRQSDRHRYRLARSALRGLHRKCSLARYPAQSRLQRRHAGRRRLRPAHHS